MIAVEALKTTDTVSEKVPENVVFRDKLTAELTPYHGPHDMLDVLLIRRKRQHFMVAFCNNI